jgi:hypothetical protein
MRKYQYEFYEIYIVLENLFHSNKKNNSYKSNNDVAEIFRYLLTLF